jgi:TfoX/Sxy family transcriptional regulator of competence genes
VAYNDLLAGRLRRALAGRSDVIEKTMFGGLTFMVAGNMCCGVHRDDLILRLDRATTVEDLKSPYARAWDFMKRPMPGMFAVSGDGCSTQETVDHWVALALGHALSLPPKKTDAPRPGAREE